MKAFVNVSLGLRRYICGCFCFLEEVSILNKVKEFITYFTKEERLLWISSVGAILISFCIFDRESYLTLSASLIGVTSLIFNAKGNPYEGNHTEVKVNRILRREAVFMWVLTAVITGVFYFVLTYFHTANIIPSTLSVTTSFMAVFLIFRRDPHFAVAYAANDVVLTISILDNIIKIEISILDNWRFL